MDSVIVELLKSGGPWAAALIAVAVYFSRREKTVEQQNKDHRDAIEKLHREKQEAVEQLSRDRLADHEVFQKMLLDLNMRLVDALNRATTAQEGTAETLDIVREKIEAVYEWALVHGPQTQGPPTRKPR